MSKKFIILALAAVSGLLLGGVGVSYLKGQDINWMFFSFNVILVVGGLYVILNKKDKGSEKEKLTWAERKELEKRKKRK